MSGSNAGILRAMALLPRLPRLWKPLGTPVLACLGLLPSLAAADFYLGPAAAGDGHGQGESNAASYLDPAVWAAANRAVAQEPTTVHWAAGHYHSGPLTLTSLGDDRHLLTLRGEGAGATLDSEGDFLLFLKGCQNLHLQNLHFTGQAGKFGVTVIGLSSERRDAIIPVPAESLHADEQRAPRPSHNIDFDGCSWIDLPEVYYGPLCLSFHTDHVTVRNCTFQRCGQERHCHMMYNGGGSHHIFIYHNTFEDCSGTYVRFRDRSDYGYVFNNVFRTTGHFAHEDASTAAFIEIPLFNSFDPGAESFGTNFSFIGNRFIWPDHPVKRDAHDPLLQLNFHTRDALRFWQDGFETRGYRTLLTKDEGYTLSLGSPAAKRALLLNNCGINADRITWYGNTYAGAMESKATYACLTEFGAFAQSRGFDAYADISNALTQSELFRDDFETDSDQPHGWSVQQAEGTVVAMRFENAPASSGTRCVFLSDSSGNGQCSISRACPIDGGFYYSGWFYFNETTSNHLCLGDGVHRWVVAGASGFWENDRGRCISNATYIPNKWYHVEVVMEQGALDYSVWVDGVLISKDIKDPAETKVSTTGSRITLSPSDGPGRGSMLVDDVQVASLGEATGGVSVRQTKLTEPNALEVTFSAAVEVEGGASGKSSALNPLNYKVSRRFFPDYDAVPLGVTQISPTRFVVRFQKPLPTPGGFLWITPVRGQSGQSMDPDGRIIAIPSH